MPAQPASLSLASADARAARRPIAAPSGRRRRGCINLFPARARCSLAGATGSADSCARMRVSNGRGAAGRGQGDIAGKWSITVLLGSALVLASASAMQAAELQVIAGGGVAAALNEIALLFERASGHTVVIRYGTAPEFIN